MVFTSHSDWFCIITQLFIEVFLSSRTDGSCRDKCCSWWCIELVWVVMVRGNFSKSPFLLSLCSIVYWMVSLGRQNESISVLGWHCHSLHLMYLLWSMLEGHCNRLHGFNQLDCQFWSFTSLSSSCFSHDNFSFGVFQAVQEKKE